MDESEVLPVLTDEDKFIHEPARLLILSYLYIADKIDFVFLRNQTGLTDGNLSSHMAKLEDREYIEVEKKFIGKKPQTLYKLTQKGRDAFREYREKMKKVFKETKTRNGIKKK
jgi:DNA-binding MarR family transcriptional regulator